LSEPKVTVVIPTLAADSALLDCLRSLEAQILRDFEVVIVDNSGRRLVRARDAGESAAGVLTILENERNAGFGAAINQGLRVSRTPFLATLNDDCVAHPEWLRALVAAIEPRPDAGMCASQVRLAGANRLDSAGMLLSADASSKQRGHGELPGRYSTPEEVLFPSGAAALYRRAMLEEVGGFDEDFFLYCEDTDLGLRARWAGWKCLYAPDAIVEHRYSHSAGRASRLKAYYVERNRLFVLLKNFPARALVFAPFAALARYGWHAWYLLRGRGAAAQFRTEGHAGWLLVWFALRAHLAMLASLVKLWKKRRAIRRTARISAGEFRRLLHAHSISPREVAAL